MKSLQTLNHAPGTFSYARIQNMGRCDLSTWSQISMAHRQKQFQVKNLAKHWNSIASLRSSISKRNKIKGVHSPKKTQWHTCRKSGRLSRNRCKFWITSLEHLDMLGIRNWEGATWCDLSTWSQISMAHRQKQFQVKSLTKHWNSIASLRFWYLQKKQNKGCPFS